MDGLWRTGVMVRRPPPRPLGRRWPNIAGQHGPVVSEASRPHPQGSEAPSGALNLFELSSCHVEQPGSHEFNRPSCYPHRPCAPWAQLPALCVGLIGEAKTGCGLAEQQRVCLACPFGPIAEGYPIIETQPSLFEALWRYKFVVVGAALLAAAAAYGVSLTQSTVYQARGEVLLNDPRSSGGLSDEIGLVLDPGRYTRNQALVMESPQVAQGASDILGGNPTTIEVQGSTSATPARDLDALTVVANQETAAEAVALVDALVASYESVITGQVMGQVNESIATLEGSKVSIEVKIAQYDAALVTDPENLTLEAQRTAAVGQLVLLDTRIESLATQGALYGSGVQLYVVPETPMVPTQPRPRRNAAIGFVLGLLAAGAYAWWRSETDQRADDRHVPAHILDAPLLGTVPDFAKVGATAPAPIVLSPKSSAASAYEFVASSLSFALEQVNGTKVVITSPRPGDGKTVTALNVSIASAHDGRNVLLVDADERSRGLSFLSGYGEATGLTDMANGTVRIDDVVNGWSIGNEAAMPFIAAGSNLAAETAGFFRSERFKHAARQLTRGRDLVVVDAPPALAVAETTDIASQADGIVVIVQEGTPLNDLVDVRERLAMSGTPILGYVFNRSTASLGSDRYGYGYGYGYGRDASNR